MNGIRRNLSTWFHFGQNLFNAFFFFSITKYGSPVFFLWVFFSFFSHTHTGQPVAVVHGANAPLLGRMIQNEMFKERMALSGEMERKVISIEEAVPSQSECRSRRDRVARRWRGLISLSLSLPLSLPGRSIGDRSNHLSDAAVAAADDEDDFDPLSTLPEDNDNVFRCLQELKKTETEQDEVRKNFGLLLIEEYIAEEESAVAAVMAKLRDVGMHIMRKRNASLSQDDVALFSMGSSLSAQHTTPLIGTNCAVLLIRCDESQNAQAQLEALMGTLRIDEEGGAHPP